MKRKVYTTPVMEQIVLQSKQQLMFMSVTEQSMNQDLMLAPELKMPESGLLLPESDAHVLIDMGI